MLILNTSRYKREGTGTNSLYMNKHRTFTEK